MAAGSRFFHHFVLKYPFLAFLTANSRLNYLKYSSNPFKLTKMEDKMAAALRTANLWPPFLIVLGLIFFRSLRGPLGGGSKSPPPLAVG